MNLIILGLIADAAGVILLGYDLVRLQRRLRRDASERERKLASVVESNEDIEKWIAELGARANWQEWDFEEGRVSYRGGTFDAEAAEDSFKDALTYIEGLGKDVRAVASVLAIALNADATAARRSLWVSYVGLTLIVVGFGFQLVGQL